jgi:hypothetical protein
MEEQNAELFKAHPLFFPVINGMIECALAGWGDPPQRNLIPFERSPANQPSRLDQFMLDALEAQWCNKNELEYLHSSVSEFCKTAMTNLEKTTTELLQCKPGELHGYGSSVKISTQGSLNVAGAHETHTECHGPPPPVPMSFTHPAPEPVVLPQKPPSVLSSPPTPIASLRDSGSDHKNALKNPKTLPKEATEVLKNWILGRFEENIFRNA